MICGYTSLASPRGEVASRSDDGEVAIRILRNHLSVAYGDSSPQGEPHCMPPLLGEVAPKASEGFYTPKP